MKTHSLPDIVKSSQDASVRDSTAVLSFSRTSLLDSEMSKSTENNIAAESEDTNTVEDVASQEVSRDVGSQVCGAETPMSALSQSTHYSATSSMFQVRI